MSLEIKCSCGKTLRVPEEMVGKKGRCPACSAIITIPGIESPSWLAGAPWLESLLESADVPEAEEQKTSYSSQDLFEQVIGSVVGVVNSSGFGSGVLISPDGIVATNRHVVGFDNSVTIRFNDSSEHPGELLRSYKDIDLAFVKTSFVHTQNAVFEEQGDVKVGQSVYAIGHPFGLQNTLTRGVISALKREIGGAEYIQTDAPINPGNSGGPLFNEYARLIGITTMGIHQSQGVAFAIPVETVAQRFYQVQDDLREIYKMTYCGICGKNSVDPKYCDNCGARLDDKLIAAEPVYRESRVIHGRCRKCNTSVRQIDKYCPNCGLQLQGN